MNDHERHSAPVRTAGKLNHGHPSTAHPPASATPRGGALARGFLLAASVALTMVVAGGTASAHTTQGSATPGNDGAHPWATNGCSTPLVRINAVPGIYDFGHACKHHDGCYTGFPRNGQPTYWVSRSQCDAWFLYDMQASCRWQHGAASTSWASRQCQQWASNYLLAVRTYGSGGYGGPLND